MAKRDTNKSKRNEYRHPLREMGYTTPKSPLSQLGKRLRNGCIAMLLLLWIGTEGYYIVGKGEWKHFDCFYMTVITVNAVGFEETLPVRKKPFGRPFTVILIFLSIAIQAYFISTVTAFFLSEEFENLWWRTRMERMAQRQKKHIIICGAGETGIHVIREFLESNINIVVIDDNEERLQGLQSMLGTFPVVVGDATEEWILEKAGIERASGIVVVLPSDKDNLFITVTARRMNHKLKIVSKGIDVKTLDKLKRAGADGVVSPNYIGGLRIAAEIIRPHVVQFLDLLSRDNELDLHIEELELPVRYPYNGQRLRDTDIRQKDLLVLAVQSPTDDTWYYNPPPDYVIEPHSTMIVMGKVGAVVHFRNELLGYI